MQPERLPDRSPLRLALQTGEPRLPVRSLGEQLRVYKGSINIHEVVGLILDADIRRKKTLSSLERRVTEPLDDEIDRIYDNPESGKLSDRLSPGVLEGFFFVAGLYQTVVDLSTRIDRFSLEAGGTLEDSFEEKAGRFAEEYATNEDLRERVPQDLVVALAGDPSGSTWLEAQVQEARKPGDFQMGEEEFDGAQRAVHGIKKLYDELLAASTKTGS